MSNIAGKAYAMNLVTPVYVKTAWLNLLFVPGIALLASAISYFTACPISYLPWGWGLLSIGGLIFLLSGLLTWIEIKVIPVIGHINEYKQWFISLVMFVVALLSTLNLGLAIFFGVLGAALIVVGLVFLKNGVVWLNRFVFWLAGIKAVQNMAFNGLIQLSLIHYARWVILRDSDFPNLSPDQPKEKLKYGYNFFLSNFNGSWTQYVDSFSVAIPGGLNLLWLKNVGWKNARVETPFNGYVQRNQIETEHYYNAYPLASSNDVKSAQTVKKEVISLASKVASMSPEDFKVAFEKVTLDLQADISQMEPSPIVSLANEAVERRENILAKYSQNS